jgi:uncharacterized cupredoxin-like copper-binding protein
MQIKSLVQVLAFALAAASTGAMAHGGDEHETAFGQEGDPARVSRTIVVDMSDAMRFTPADIVVKKGETVKFVVRNSGKVLHELVLGTPQALKEHAELMKKFPAMEHADANMAHVRPGKTGEIVWLFNQAGDFRYACLQPGHYEAGMVGKVVVK